MSNFTDETKVIAFLIIIFYVSKMEYNYQPLKDVYTFITYFKESICRYNEINILFKFYEFNFS